MGLFNQFPFTNFHEMNMDWLINKQNDIDKKIDNIPSYLDSYLDSWLETHMGEIISKLAPTAYVNVKDFGAKGDGITNDHDAIVSAINSAKNNGGTLYFPAGNYKLVGIVDLPIGVSITGDGPLKSIINHESTAFRFVSPSPNVPSIETVYSSIALVGNKIGYGFEMVNASSYLFYNVKFLNQDVGVYATGGNNIGFVKCSFTTQARKGIWLGAKDSRVYIEHIDGIYMLACSFGEIPVMIQDDGSVSTATLNINSCQFYAYESYSDVCVWLDRTHGVTVENSWFELNDHVRAIVLSNKTYEGVATTKNTTFTMIGSYVGSKHKIAVEHNDGSNCTLISNTFVNPSEYSIKTIDNQTLTVINTYYEGAPDKKCNFAGNVFMAANELGATFDYSGPSSAGVTFTNTITYMVYGIIYSSFTCAVNGSVVASAPPLVTAYAANNVNGDGWSYNNGSFTITGNGESKTYMCILPVRRK